MWNQLLLIMIGFSAGIIIAGGEVGLLIGLSIIPRYAGITHTGKHILLYEDSILLGTVLGNFFSFGNGRFLADCSFSCSMVFSQDFSSAAGSWH